MRNDLVTVIAAPDGVHVRTFASTFAGPPQEPHPEVIMDIAPVGSVSAAVVWSG